MWHFAINTVSNRFAQNRSKVVSISSHGLRLLRFFARVKRGTGSNTFQLGQQGKWYWNTSLSQCTETFKIFQQNDAGKLSLIPSFKNFLVPKWIYFENSQGVESIRKILRKFGTGSKLIRFGCGVTDVKFPRNRVHSVCSFRLLIRPPGGGKKIWRPACKISLTPP